MLAMLPSSLRFLALGLSGCALSGLFLLFPGKTAAQQVTSATIVEILDSDQVFIQERKARRNDVGRLGQQIRTARARAGLRLNLGAGLRLGRNSSIIVGSDCVRLTRGQVLLTGANRRGCVGSIIAATRGTVYVLELTEQNQSRVTVLEGEVVVSSETAAQTSGLSVKAGETLTASDTGVLSPVSPLSQSQLQNLSNSLLEGFQESLPDLEKVVLKPQTDGFTSTFLGEALTGGDSFSRPSDPQKGESATNFTSLGNTSGTFLRTGENTATFTPATGGPIVPITVNFDSQTITIGGVSGIASSLGLSGNNASGTVILQNGQAIRLEVFGVNRKEPRIGTTLPGQLSVGSVRDR